MNGNNHLTGKRHESPGLYSLTLTYRTANATACQHFKRRVTATNFLLPSICKMVPTPEQSNPVASPLLRVNDEAESTAICTVLQEGNSNGTTCSHTAEPTAFTSTTSDNLGDITEFTPTSPASSAASESLAPSMMSESSDALSDKPDDTQSTRSDSYPVSGDVADEEDAAVAQANDRIHAEYSQNISGSENARLDNAAAFIVPVHPVLAEHVAVVVSVEPIAVVVSTEDIEREVRARILEEAVVASSVENITDVNHGSDEQHDSSENSNAKLDTVKKLRSWHWIAAGLTILVVVAGASIGIAASSNDNDNVVPAATSAPTLAPSASETSTDRGLRDLIVSLSFDNGAPLEDPTSAQYMAYSYLRDSNIYGTSDWYDRDVLQIYSLATFYFSTNGPESWIKKNGWVTAPDINHPCTWHGVYCEVNSNRTQTDTGSRRLKAPPPLSRRALDEAADSSSNATGFVGEVGDIATLLRIFEEVQALPRSFSVVALFLPSNGLDGFGLAELAFLTTLLAIDVSGNNFNSQALPLDVVLLSYLKFINCSNSRFAEPLRTLGFLAPTLSHLEVADISKNRISGTLPSLFGDMPHLRILVADHNPVLTGSVPDKLCQLPNITRVTVDCDLISCSCCTPRCAPNNTSS
jgi:hypothetical protein